MNLGLGIDTGGTYTDAVLLDFGTGHILRKAKALTTYPNLEAGIAAALDELEGGQGMFPVDDITLVAVSTTLATNAMVEGKGGRVGLLAVGFLPGLLEKRGLDKQPFVELRHLIGGHNTDGEEQAPLDLSAAERAIEETKALVDAYAVVALGSPFNPAHEIRLVELVREKTDVPVVSGIEFSRELDSVKRATTALFNARLTPLVQQFIRAMQQLLSGRGVTAPLMVVKGDGHLIRAELAMEHPIETVLSGPAASFIGARYLSGFQDGIVLDIGGTTTDIAVLKDGVPHIDPKGAVVAGWRTNVRAAEIHTSGLGGDSHLRLNPHNEITVGPQRVIPLAFAGAYYPGVLAQLHELESAGWDSMLVQPCDFLVLRTSPPAPLPDRSGQALEGEGRKSSPSPSLPLRPRGGWGWGAEEGRGVRLVEKLQDGPRSLWHLAREMGVTHPSLLNTTEIESRGDLARIGLTPTDVLHAQGFFTDWSVEAAQCGIRLYAKRLGMCVEETISALRAAIDEKITAEVMTVLLNQAGVQDGFGNGHPTGRDVSIRGFLVKRVLNHAQSGQDKGSAFAGGDNGWSIDLKVHLPLIGIGAPAHAYLPPIASALQAKVTIPEHAEVANAVGAIIGGIVETVEIDVHPVYNITGIDRYEVRSPVGVCTFQNRELALQHAMKLGEQLATEKAKRAGGEQIEVRLERSDQDAAAGSDSSEPIYLGTRIQATGVGRRMGESVNR